MVTCLNQPRQMESDYLVVLMLLQFRGCNVLKNQTISTCHYCLMQSTTLMYLLVSVRHSLYYELIPRNQTTTAEINWEQLCSINAYIKKTKITRNHCITALGLRQSITYRQHQLTKTGSKISQLKKFLHFFSRNGFQKFHEHQEAIVSMYF